MQNFIELHEAPVASDDVAMPITLRLDHITRIKEWEEGGSMLIYPGGQFVMVTESYLQVKNRIRKAERNGLASSYADGGSRDINVNQ